MIRSLSKDVRSLLRSGVAIFSLQQCVEELVLNSIDAGATCVAVKIDIEACKIQVIDNGSGMDQENMERVGIRYCTSKCSSIGDLDNLCFYGFRGEAVASMASLASMVEITSRTRTSVKTFVKRFQEGAPANVFEAETTRPSAGTTVQIFNIFHKMPVRRKRLDSALEVERVRQRVEAISLVHPSVSFTVKKDCSDTLLVQLPKARNTYYRFAQIHGLNRAQKLGEVNYTLGPFEMTGHVGREGHYNKNLQFLFVNGRLLLKTRLHKLLNCLLRRPSGAQTNSVSAVMSSPKQKGSSELHAVYIIRIKCPYSEYDVCLEPAKSLLEFKDWDAVLLCIEEGVKTFLTKENLVPECSLSDIQASGNKESSPEGNLSTPGPRTGHDEEMPEQVQSNTEPDPDPEKEPAKDNSIDEPLPKALGNTQCTLGDDDTSPPCAASKPIVQNSRIAVIDPKEAYDSLRRFADSNVSCAPKRKSIHVLSRTHGSDGGLKIARVAPGRKLTLSFETGSLDKFKRMFVKEGESKEYAMLNPRIPDALCPADSFVTSALGPISNLVPSEKTAGARCFSFSFSKDNSALHKAPCSSKRSGISLAAKLSRKVDHEDAQTNLERETSCNPVKNATIDSIKAIENKVNNEGAVAENFLTAKPGEGDRSDEPAFIAPNGQETSTFSSTPTSEDAELTKNTTSPKPDNSRGHIVDPASQRDLSPHERGNEEQAGHESRGQEGDETEPVASDWLTHYDDSLAKWVHINQVTGLSTYQDPSLKETRVPCSRNLTNMAVSVVLKTGPSSLSTLYTEWNNPVFVRPPQVAVDVTSSNAEGLAVKIHNVLFPYRFTKEMIYSMKVIHQVDKKFLACLIKTTVPNTAESSENEGNLLVLVDQHAAHERVRLEGLVMESYEDDPDTPGNKRLCGSSVSPPLEIHMSEDEIRLLRLYQLPLRDLALEISFPHPQQSLVLVERLPKCFVEKENTERRRGRRSVIQSIAEEYLREHIEAVQSMGRLKSTLPLTVHNILASQACHGAIKFNDELTKEECCSLVGALSSCQLPFQCAHGRPSILPLADLHHLEDEQGLSKPNLRKLRRMYKAWQLYGKQ